MQHTINPALAARFAAWTRRRFESALPNRQVIATSDGQVITWHDAEFRLVAHVEPDYEPSDEAVEHLGTFVASARTVDDPRAFPATFRRRRANKHHDHVRGDEYFRPTYSVAERVADKRRAGMARGPAYAEALAEARADWKRAEEFGDTWHLNYATVICYAAQDTAGRDELARASMYSVESDGDEEYVDGILSDLGDEARDEARETLAKRERARRAPHVAAR